MSLIKQVKYLLPALEIDLGGLAVKQLIPTERVGRVDPFLLLHHGIIEVEDWIPAHRQGFDPHPHKGFSPVTFVVSGEIHHRDSRGHDQIAKDGEVQWMHAGNGIIHSERPSKAMVEKGGSFEIVQLWINSPSDKKRAAPDYQYLSKDHFVSFLSSDGKINNQLIAGHYHQLVSDTRIQSELVVIWGEGSAGGMMTYDVPQGFQSMLYVISGNIQVKKYGPVEKQHLAIFEEKGDEIEITINEAASFLLLMGLPINEEVVQSGPFVMNSQTEVMEAMRDYRMGKMGILIEDF